MKPRSLEWWQSQRPEVVGKETEKLVEDVLKQRNQSQTFAWSRFPDAKAARGLIKAQPADYLVCSNGRMILLEAKALKHEYRLPRDRVTQLPVMRKFEMAGALGVILVHHYMQGLWRVVRAGELEIGRPSWDLSDVPAFTNPYEALETIL